MLQAGQEELKPGVLGVGVLLHYGMQWLSLRGVLLQGAVDWARVVFGRCVVVPSRGRVEDRTSKGETRFLAHLRNTINDAIIVVFSGLHSFIYFSPGSQT